MTTRKPSTFDLNGYCSPATFVEQHQLVEQHRREITAGAALLDHVHTYLIEPPLEWLVPESWEWGEVGVAGELLGVPFRVVAGIDTLFLAQAVKPGA